MAWCSTEPVVIYLYRADSRFAPSQWEMSLQSNTVSHWLGANLASALFTVHPKNYAHGSRFVMYRYQLNYPYSSGSLAQLTFILMHSCKTAISPQLTHWRYCSLALIHWYDCWQWSKPWRKWVVEHGLFCECAQPMRDDVALWRSPMEYAENNNSIK